MTRVSWQQLFLAILHDVISWPVAVIVIVFVLRKQLRALVGRIRSYEGMGQRLTFGEQLADAEEGVNELAAADPSPVPEAKAAVASVTSASMPPATPAGAILDAWRKVESQMNRLAGVRYVSGPTKPAGERVPRLTTRMAIRNTALLLPSLGGIIEDLRVLRNRVAHGDHEPTEGEAVTYFQTASAVAGMIEIFTDEVAATQALNSPDAGSSNGVASDAPGLT